MSGAEYRDENGEVIDSIGIDKSKVKDIIDTIAKESHIIEMYTNKGVFTTKYSEKDYQDSINRAKQFNSEMSEEDVIKLLAKLRSKMIEFSIDKVDELLSQDIIIYKMLTFHSSKKTIKELKSKISKIGGLAVASTTEYDIEINDVQAQKGTILAKVAKLKGINNDEVIVFGDSFNDYSMFKEFKNSYAMENAIPEIKEIATYITDTNNNDGVGKAILKAINKHK